MTSHQGTRGGYRLAQAASRHLGRRHHPGHRRPADGHRLLDRGRELRAVRQVQRPRSALAHPDRILSALATCSLQEISTEVPDCRWPASPRRWRSPASSESPASRPHRSDARDRVAVPQCRSPSISTTTPRRRSIRACSRRCCRTSPSTSAIPPAGSTPTAGRRDEAVDAARGEVAALIGATAGEIVFTSGATESNNLAIKGAAHACRERGDHVITVATEHKSVLDSFKTLEREGWRVTRLGVDADGFIRLDELRAAITDTDRARLGDGGEQRDRRRCSRSPRSARSSAPPARCCTPTRRRRPARCRSTSTRWASICCR